MKKVLGLLGTAFLLSAGCSTTIQDPKDMDYANKYLSDVQNCFAKGYEFESYSQAHNYLESEDTDVFKVVFERSPEDQKIIPLESVNLAIENDNKEFLIRYIKISGKPSLFTGLKCRRLFKPVNVKEYGK